MPRLNRALNLTLAVAAIIALAPALTVPAARADADAAGPFPASLPTRADLAHTFLRFERAYATFQRTAETTLEFNRGFDAATRMFFSGDLSRPLRQIDSLSLRALGAEAEADTDASIAISLAARIEPAVHHIGAGGPAPQLVITSRYIAAPEERRSGRIRLQLRLLNAHGNTWESPIDAPIDAAGRIALRRPLEAPASILQPGRLRIELRTRAGLDIDAGHWSIIDRDLQLTHTANRKRLDAIDNAQPHLHQALNACRDRNSLLALPPDSQQSARYLLDPHELMHSLDHEIAALNRGENPYKHRPGRIWRTLSIEQSRMPLTVYAPEAPPENPALVIALHGAGGEETMFFEAYGAGLIRDLADEHGFIVAAPLTTTFVSTPAWFDLLVNTMAAEHNIDRERVYMIGHSLGAMTASAVARMRPDDVAAICCIAGGFFNQSDDPPPTLLIPAEFDPIVPASRMLPGARAARDRGADIEIRLAEGQGHTLLVPDVLADAIDWLLSHRPAP